MCADQPAGARKRIRNELSNRASLGLAAAAAYELRVARALRASNLQKPELTRSLARSARRLWSAILLAICMFSLDPTRRSSEWHFLLASRSAWPFWKEALEQADPKHNAERKNPLSLNNAARLCFADHSHVRLCFVFCCLQFLRLFGRDTHTHTRPEASNQSEAKTPPNQLTRSGHRPARGRH